MTFRIVEDVVGRERRLVPQFETTRVELASTVPATAGRIESASRSATARVGVSTRARRPRNGRREWLAGAGTARTGRARLGGGQRVSPRGWVSRHLLPGAGGGGGPSAEAPAG